MSFESLLGSGAAWLFGAGLPRSYTHESTVTTSFALGRDGNEAYAHTFEWSPAFGQRSRARVGLYATREEADAALASVLTGMGYEPARWWHFWRWGSPLLPDEVSKRMPSFPSS